MGRCRSIMSKGKINGASRLAVWIAEQRNKSGDSMEAGMAAGWVWSLTAFAKQVGVSRQMVRHWLKGYAKPSYENREQVERATQGAVHPGSWDLAN